MKETILRILFSVFIFLFISTFYVVIYFLKKERDLTNRIYPNVYIEKINFGNQTADRIKGYFDQKNEKLKTIQIFLNYKDRENATFSGNMISLKYDVETIITQSYSIGRTTAFFPKIYQKLKTIFNFGNFTFPAVISYQKKPISDYLTYLEDKYNLAAENALFNFEQGKVTAFRIEKNGLMIKKEDVLNDLDMQINKLKDDRGQNLYIKISDEIIKPNITLSSVNNFGIVEKIGEGKSDYSGSIPERIHNIILAASKLNGILIPKDEIFSFNKIIGDVSASTGYKPAYIIKNGRTILGDGGGLCQVSTTLFRAILNIGLPIIERTAHAYRVHYYENDSKPGFDATVFSPNVDLKFQNDTLSHILIQTNIDKNKNILTFNLYGKKDNRQIQITEVKMWDILPPPAPRYQDDPTLKRGITKQIDWAAWGTKTVFHYKVEKEGQIIMDKDFFSFYRPWQAVYLVGVAD